MEVKDNYKLSYRLQGIRFFLLPKVPYDIVFRRLSIKNSCSIDDKLYRAPLALIKRAFVREVNNIEYKTSPHSKILLYLSDPIRKSNEVNFNKVASTIDHPDTLIERHRKSFSFQGIFLLFIALPIWYLQMKGRGLATVEIYQILKDLIEVYPTQKFFRNIPIRKYNLLVCYYDSIVHECMLNLMFKKEGVKTATLQHGQFNAWRENTIANCGLEFYASPSDYHLCWNKFAQEEAIKCGWEKEKLPIVGIMSNIGRNAEKCRNPNNDIFGVVISHPYWKHENYEMIKAANLISKQYNLKYYLKLHPNYRDDYFKEVVNERYLGNTKKGIDTLEYCNLVDFTIVGSTSFFVEMVYCYHDILRYSSQLPSDKYRDIKLGCVFNKAEDILSCYENLAESSKEQLFDYLCETTDTTNLHNTIFNQLSNG